VEQPGEDHQGNRIPVRQLEEVRRPLLSLGGAHAEGFPRVSERGPLAGEEHAGEEGVDEEVDEGEDGLGEIGDEDGGDEGGVPEGGERPAFDEGLRVRSANSERPERCSVLLAIELGDPVSEEGENNDEGNDDAVYGVSVGHSSERRRDEQ
jgi:hypothetical protein